MVVADLARVGIFAVLAVHERAPAQIVVLAAAAGFATGFFRPASYAGLPNLVDADDLAGGELAAARQASTSRGRSARRSAASSSRSPGPDPAYVVNAVDVPRLGGAHPPHRAAPAPGRRPPSAVGTGATSATASRSSSARACCSPSSSRGTSSCSRNAGINVAEIVLAKVDFSTRRRRLRLHVGGVGPRAPDREPLGAALARAARHPLRLRRRALPHGLRRA